MSTMLQKTLQTLTLYKQRIGNAVDGELKYSLTAKQNLMLDT